MSNPSTMVRLSLVTRLRTARSEKEEITLLLALAHLEHHCPSVHTVNRMAEDDDVEVEAQCEEEMKCPRLRKMLAVQARRAEWL